MKIGVHSSQLQLLKPSQSQITAYIYIYSVCVCMYIYLSYSYAAFPLLYLHHLKTFLWHRVTRLKLFVKVVWPYFIAAEFVQSKVEKWKNLYLLITLTGTWGSYIWKSSGRRLSQHPGYLNAGLLINSVEYFIKIKTN